jgi:ribosomal protein S12 methylthiotransferase accessory factor
MKVKYITDLANYHEVGIGEISVYFNKQFIFIGPIRTYNSACFNCFQERVKEQKLSEYYFSTAKHLALNDVEEEIVKSYLEKIADEKEQGIIYIFNRITKECELVSTFKRGDCLHCSSDDINYVKRERKKEGYPFEKSNPRQDKWENVKNRLQKFKPLLYKNRFSLINRINRSGDSYGLPMVETEVYYKNVSMLSYGRTSTYEKSRYTAILESLERYATAFPYKRSPYHFREKENENIDLKISEIIELNNLEKGEYSADTPIYYTEVDALHKGKKALIPEQIVYFDSHHSSDEKRYIFESSNGSALGSTLEEASLFAMLELFERDSFLCTWYGKIPPIRIETELLKSSKIQNYIVALQRKGIKVHVFDISIELKIPTIWVLLEKQDPKESDMAFYTAAATSFDLEDAIEKALIEATTAISVFSNLFRGEDFQQRKRMLLKDPTKVSRLEDHLLLYSNQEMKSYLEFALNTPYHTTDDELEKYYLEFNGEYTEVLEYLQGKILEISDKAYRAATENINLNELGFVNVKYVVPKMLTMTFGHQNRRIVKSRVEKAIAYKGRGYVDTEWMEKIPHPFP